MPVRVAAYVFVAARERYDVRPLDGHLYATLLAPGAQREEGENGLPEVLDPLDLDVEGLVVPRTLQCLPQFERPLASSIDRRKAGKRATGDPLPSRCDHSGQPLIERPAVPGVNAPPPPLHVLLRHRL